MEYTQELKTVVVKRYLEIPSFWCRFKLLFFSLLYSKTLLVVCMEWQVSNNLLLPEQLISIILTLKEVACLNLSPVPWLSPDTDSPRLFPDFVF